jgi:flavodoxin I
MNNLAIIYSFNTHKSKKISEKIIKALGKTEITPVNAEELNKNIFEKYDNFLLSAPTWFDGELPNYWDEFVPDLEEMDLRGKKFAIFGLGDQKGYPENFCDAIGILADIIENCGGKTIGHTKIKNYNFEASKAQRGDKFVGLPLDQENQARMTDSRINEWVEQIKKEFQ